MRLGVELALASRQFLLREMARLSGVNRCLIPLLVCGCPARHPGQSFKIFRRDAVLSLVAAKFSGSGSRRVLGQLSADVTYQVHLSRRADAEGREQERRAEHQTQPGDSNTHNLMMNEAIRSCNRDSRLQRLEIRL